MRRIVLVALAGALLAAASPASGRPATACSAGYKPVRIDGQSACLRTKGRCTRRAVLHHRHLRRLCIRMVPRRPGGPKPAAVQSIARR
jgi:hypothetical protein